MLDPLPYVIVSLTTGVDLRGVLREMTSDALVLTAAAVAGEEAGHTVWRALPGEVVVPMSRVDYWQRTLPPDILSMLGV